MRSAPTRALREYFADFHVVSGAVLAAEGIPGSVPLENAVMGQVFDATTKLPIAGATVRYGFSKVRATLSDREGHYLVCAGQGPSTSTSLAASKAGYHESIKLWDPNEGFPSNDFFLEPVTQD